MGNPGATDTHPLHGELPNAPFRDAQLIVGRDADGAFMALTGTYRHTVAFSHNYVATPVVRLTAGSSRIRLDLSVRNLRHTPMELMYLAHVNFRPVDGATAGRRGARRSCAHANPDEPAAWRSHRHRSTALSSMRC